MVGPYQGVENMSKENHESKLNRGINPNKSSFHYTRNRRYIINYNGNRTKNYSFDPEI